MVGRPFVFAAHNTTLVAPAVRHVQNGYDRHLPRSIFVGSIHGTCDYSPFCCPLCGPCDAGPAYQYLYNRADIYEFMFHLHGKVLVCDCRLAPRDCWANILRMVFRDCYPRCSIDDRYADELAVISSDSCNVACPSSRADDVNAAGLQAVRHRYPQLIPDGLQPDEHLAVALNTKHPYLSKAGSTLPVKYALQWSKMDADAIQEKRAQVVEALQGLANATAVEDEYILSRVHPQVAATLRAYERKNVAFMREVGYVSMPRDYCAIAALVIGLPMIGWTQGAEGLMERIKPPMVGIEEWRRDRPSRNERILGSVTAPDDPELAEISFMKSSDEVEAGVLDGPYFDVNEIPVGVIGLAPRRGMWEYHGDAIDPAVRNIDDLLAGGQNETCGTTHSHRPTDVDGLVAQARAVADHFEGEEIAGWTSDYSKAFKQIPADPTENGAIVLVQWCPERKCLAFFVSYCQVFGSKNAPLNFSRFPAWACEVHASLLGIPASHCVDDVISIERLSTTAAGRECWLVFTKLCGWKISLEKSPPPSQMFKVIGVSIDLRRNNGSPMTVMVTKRRLQSLSSLIKDIIVKNALTSGVAASLAGKLGFTISATFGRIGRSQIRPISARAYSYKRKLHDHLKACLVWWLRYLRTYSPRPVPTSLELLPTLVSYSDGEGGDAGIGVAVWVPWLRRPLAAFLTVPESIRQSWAVARGTDQCNDIFVIEALGPLVLLTTFPKIMRNALWIHYIDNTAAEASLIRGSSSLATSNNIVCLTWELCHQNSLWPYFDRVESKANPVDKLSRGCFWGPWDEVKAASFPSARLRAIQNAC